MSDKKQKKSELDLWAAHFERYQIFKDKFLLQRSGPIIYGICLEPLANSHAYKPTFFLHNLTVNFPVLSLGYAAPLLSRGVYLPVDYGGVVDRHVNEMKRTIAALSYPMTYRKYFDHLVGTLSGNYGVQAVYLPHILRDLACASAYAGDAEYVRSNIFKCADVLKTTDNLNYRIIGTIDDWVKNLDELLVQDLRNIANENSEKFKLNFLECEPFEFKRIENFWEITKQ